MDKLTMEHNCKTTFVNGINPFRPYSDSIKYTDILPWDSREHPKTRDVLSYLAFNESITNYQAQQILRCDDAVARSVLRRLIRGGIIAPNGLAHDRPETMARRGTLYTLTERGKNDLLH